ncbi:thioredoxin-like protein [Bipolaris maydis]|nr:thioredoxin-like protein [Bipolaris maydis]KAJ6269261.1 thioredoxin-like protein [Bipolaris maydis]KAJ6280074.1 thioredoxin-like protein [Bipolaris maydis]
MLVLGRMSEGAAGTAAAVVVSHVRWVWWCRAAGGVGLGIRRGARSLSTAPRCDELVARSRVPPGLLTSHRPATSTATNTFFAATRTGAVVRSPELYERSTVTTASCKKREYATMASATSFYEFKPKDKKGQPYDLSQLSNKVVLVVNTASKCGFTPQFEGLEKLYKDIKSKYPDDFEILGFPCNQFGGQDPGTNEEIQEFCQVNYGVSFPVLGKIDVNGSTADPAFEWLKNEKPGLMGLKRVKWNFEKFLIGRDGKVKGRWASTKKPEDLKAEIEKELSKK